MCRQRKLPGTPRIDALATVPGPIDRGKSSYCQSDGPETAFEKLPPDQERQAGFPTLATTHG